MRLRDHYAHVLEKFPDAPDRYELTVREVYAAILAKGATALDLGAHTGKHALPMGRAVGPNGRVYAFEPIIEKFKALTDNVESSGLAQISPLNVCCLDENKIVTFIYLPTDPGKSAIHVRKALERDTVEKVYQKCLSIRLDDFFGADIMPDFIKVDIEGAELAALRGASALIERARPVLHIEIGPPSLDAFGVRPGEIFEFLNEARYNLIDILGNPLHDIDAYSESVDADGVYDYIAVPHDDPREMTVVDACRRMWNA